jgi:hypothetical protein
MSAIRAAVAVLAVLFGASSALLLVIAARTSLKRRGQRAWRRATAVIVGADWEGRPEDQGVLRLAFDVEGRRSTALDIGEEQLRDDQRDELLARFEPGTEHPALVDPSGASPPLLVTGLVQPPLVPLVLAGIFLVIAGVMAGLAWYLGRPDNLLSRLLAG